ncbi:MAG: hypothetical protein LBR88_01040 [Zoogloeaceae bacterium]|nr:hypothetical protein [Zoogloeaceae bacterium]
MKASSDKGKKRLARWGKYCGKKPDELWKNHPDNDGGKFIPNAPTILKAGSLSQENGSIH